jgi:hypothetical protein
MSIADTPTIPVFTPPNISTMSPSEIISEKHRIKKELTLLKETQSQRQSLGETISNTEKQRMKELYQWYGTLKESVCELETSRAVPVTKESLQLLKSKKRDLQLELHQFQTEFQKLHGRPVTGHDVRETAYLATYKQYKVQSFHLEYSKAN